MNAVCVPVVAYRLAGILGLVQNDLFGGLAYRENQRGGDVWGAARKLGHLMRIKLPIMQLPSPLSVAASAIVGRRFPLRAKAGGLAPISVSMHTTI